jgi:hypothetical protein
VRVGRAGDGQGVLGMNTQEQIDKYLADLSPQKSGEMLDLHQRIIAISPNCRLWFLDGRNSDGKIVSNPNIGYGSTMLEYVNGEQREFYRVGLSANTIGISVYIMNTPGKRYLQDNYAEKLGKANVTGYCIKFRTTKDVDIKVLDNIISDAMGRRPGLRV